MKKILQQWKTLSPEEHINNLSEETYMMQNIRLSFHFMDKERMKIIMIRSKFEYAVVAWLPCKEKNIGKL